MHGFVPADEACVELESSASVTSSVTISVTSNIESVTPELSSPEPSSQYTAKRKRDKKYYSDCILPHAKGHTRNFAIKKKKKKKNQKKKKSLFCESWIHA